MRVRLQRLYIPKVSVNDGFELLFPVVLLSTCHRCQYSIQQRYDIYMNGKDIILLYIKLDYIEG